MHLVRAGNDYVLLGSAEQGVVPIHRYTEEEAREAGLMDVIEAPRGSRRGLLRPPGRRRSAGAAATAGSESQNAAEHDPMQMPSPGPGSSLVDRLRELTVRR